MGQLIYVEAPNPIPSELDGMKLPIVFLAGGITGCSDWQKELVELLTNYMEKLPANKRTLQELVTVISNEAWYFI